MAIRIYDTLSGKKRNLKPLKGKKVNLFVCGPTVYDNAHIGHARTYIAFDIFVKYLRRKKFNVFYLQNITDVEDKIINRANERKISPKKLAEEFEKEYMNDMKTLKIDSVTKYARATDHIPEVISQVKRLLLAGYAYKIDDGIYYDISKFKNYGKLSKRTVSQAEDGVSRIDEGKGKINKGDFCLWKFWKPSAGERVEPKWSSPFGEGRPGWHIEDTAITEKYFGAQYDIHGGGSDLMFPHHEAEIAQIEAISKKSPLVKHWMHTGPLTVGGVKMSKSLGNFITIKDFLKTDPEAVRIFRLLVVKNHYRSPIDYSENEIGQTKAQLKKFDEFTDKMKEERSKIQNNNRILQPAVLQNPSQDFEKITENEVSREFTAFIKKTEDNFEKCIDSDFNTPKALAVIFGFIKKVNLMYDQNKIHPKEADVTLRFLEEIDKLFDFMISSVKKAGKVPDVVKDILERREAMRKQKEWEKADELRNQLEQLGFKVEDTKDGQKLKEL